MSIDDVMYKAARKHSKVRVTCLDGTNYTGTACYYTKADDEEDGFATFCIKEAEMCLAENEIKSIELL